MSKTDLRIGSGFDAHRYAPHDVPSTDTSLPNNTIVLAGIRVPYDKKVIAHSDGDVVLHALCDALLGALALGDIGKHFPDTDVKYKNVDSRFLLRETLAKLLALHYGVINVDLTIIAEAPRVSTYIDAMREVIAEDLNIEMSCVSVKATTTEKMGFVGREEGIASQATVLLESICDD